MALELYFMKGKKMQKIKETNLYLGNMYDYEDIRDVRSWSALHCCKVPYHQELVGYSKNLSPEHPYYKCISVGNRMALNIVDMDRFDRRYLGFNKDMFKEAFDFLDHELERGQKVLVHCNEGLSRSPMILLLYLCYKGYNGYNYLDFETAYRKFLNENNVMINARLGIFETVKNLWDDFAKEGLKIRKNA